MEKDLIFKKLNELKLNSYSNYSHFKVACIIELKNGVFINGVNVESVAYSPTICAERTAIAQLYTQGYRKDDVKEVYLYTDSESFGTPCGVCRQFMSELLNIKQAIHIFNKIGFVKTISIEKLLPFAFSENEL